MFELALLDWGLTPDYLLDNWTDELLALMFLKRRDRLRAQQTPADEDGAPRRVSNETFIRNVRQNGGGIVFEKG